jgi:hypothetical protein
MTCHLGTGKTYFAVLLILWREGGGDVNLVWQQCSMMAEEGVVILHEDLSAKFIQIIVNRLVFRHTLCCSWHSKVVRDFYVTELEV